MKPIEVYKDAVMRRAEDKQRARRRAVRRTLTVCLSLCLCLGVIGATVLPIGEDRAPELNGDACVDEYSDGFVRHGNTPIAVMGDADAVYKAILTLYDTVGDLTGHSYGDNSELAENADAEAFPEDTGDDGSTNGTAPYYLCFTRPEGEYVFLLQSNVLTDLTNGRITFVTEEQAQALISGSKP